MAEPASAPETATPLSLVAARSLCAEALRQAKSGSDPAAAKQRQRQERLATESDTLRAISEEYLRREGPRLRTLSQRRADLELLCASVLGRLPVAEIKRGQYTRVLDHIADHNGLARADRVLSAAKTLLNWHAGRSDFISPLGRGGRRTSIRERARERVLTDDELRRVWLAADQDKGPFGPFVRFVLLTATRRGEAGGLRRSELSDGGRTWVIPGARYKSGKDTLIPLSAAAQRIIAERPQLGGGDHVFSAATGAQPLGGFGDRKKDFDKVCGVSGWRIHDLRRTARTLLSRAGISADHAEMCLGHALGGVRGTYDRHAYETEKRNAFEALAALIERIVLPSTDVVVQMPKAGAQVKRDDQEPIPEWMRRLVNGGVPLPIPEWMRRFMKVLAERRIEVDPALLRSLGQAREQSNAALVSRWDFYEGAIEAADAGDTDRLALCLRGHKPFADGDQDRLATFISKKVRRRRWPRWLVHALSRTPTEAEYDLLADLVAKVGRKRGRVADVPAHRAARLARVLLSHVGPGARWRDAVIAIACKIEGDESGVKFDEDREHRVRNLLDHPGARDTKRL